MSLANYWKIRTLVLERQQVQASYEATMKAVMEKLDAEFAAAGLEKQKNYRMDDQTETIVIEEV